MGFEPTTIGLRVRCSTFELRVHKCLEPDFPRDPELRAVHIADRLGQLHHDPRGLPARRDRRLIEVEPVGHHPVVLELVEHDVERETVRVYQGKDPRDDDLAVRRSTYGPATPLSVS